MGRTTVSRVVRGFALRHRSSLAPRPVPGVLLVALLLAACNGGGPERNAAATYTLPELQDDFDQLRKLIDRKHPHYFTDRALSMPRSTGSRLCSATA